MTSRTSPPDHVVARLTADTEPYLSCDECFARLDQYVEELVRNPQHQDEVMRTHVLNCVACADEAESLLELLTSEPR